jgi:predicted small integral membrane protein
MGFTVSQAIRLSKALIVLTVGLLGLLVVFGNVTDYNTNFQFVKHVLSMDSVDKVPDNTIAYRAITSTAFHHFAYIVIIIWEALITLLCLFGSYKMFRKFNAPAEEFHESKKWGVLGLTACFLLWFFGFQVVAGEWFGMWMNSIWNGIPDAFRLVTYQTVALVFIVMKND